MAAFFGIWNTRSELFIPFDLNRAGEFCHTNSSVYPELCRMITDGYDEYCLHVVPLEQACAPESCWVGRFSEAVTAREWIDEHKT